MDKRQWPRRYYDAPVWFACSRPDNAFEVVSILYWRTYYADRERGSRSLRCAQITYRRRVRWVVNERCTSDARRDLFEQFNPFRANSLLVIGKPCNITAWPRQACHKAVDDWIRDIGEHDWCCVGHL